MEEKKGAELYEFPNGFRLAWLETPSDTVFANLRVNHGALHENEGEEGIAHFLEHLLIEAGTKKYSPAEQAKKRGRFGYSNAMTSRDRTIIPFGMISSDLEDYLDMVSEMAFYPRLDEKAIEQQKGVVLREIARRKGAPDFDDIVKFYWPSLARDRDHTYFVLGDEEVIKNVSKQELKEFHERGYSPNNMILMLAGNLPDNLVDRVEKYFGGESFGKGSPIEFSEVEMLDKKSVRHSFSEDLLNRDNPKCSNSHLMVGFVVPDENHKDSAALDVCSEAFGRSYTNGLKKRIRSEEGISYDIGSSYSGQQKFGSFNIQGKVDSRRQEKALEIIFEEMDKMKSSLLEEDEILRAKRRAAYRAANGLSNSMYSRLVGVDPVNVNAVMKIDYDLEGRIPVKKKLIQIDNLKPEEVRKVSESYFPLNIEDGRYVMLLRDPLKER
jgi:predicted Zn-dependent peptidase